MLANPARRNMPVTRLRMAAWRSPGSRFGLLVGRPEPRPSAPRSPRTDRLGCIKTSSRGSCIDRVMHRARVQLLVGALGRRLRHDI
jgi:hypothetical protein